MSRVFKSHDKGVNRKTLRKDVSTLDFTESEVKEILKRLNQKVEENKINLESKVHRIDPDQRLTEKEFFNMFSSKDLDLTKSETKTLFNKYFNTMDNSVYVDQLLKDLKDQHKIASKFGERKPDPKMLKKLAKKCRDENTMGLIIKECFMMDKDEDGVLSKDQIKKSFHNGKLRISDYQLDSLLMNQVLDRDHKYEYAKILTEMFGEKEVKRYKERMTRSSNKKKSTMSGKKNRPRGKDEDRLGIKKLSYSSSRDSNHSMISRDSRTSRGSKMSRGSIMSRDSINSRVSRNSSKNSMNSRDDKRIRDKDRGRKNINKRDDSLNPRVTSLEKREDRSISLNPRNKDRSSSLHPRNKKNDSVSPVGARKGYNKGKNDRDISLNKRVDSLNPRSKSKGKNYNDEYSSSELSQEKSLDKSKSYGKDSPRDDFMRNKSKRSVKQKDHLKPVPGKGNLKRNETTSITRFVGTRIKASKQDYIAAFKRSNGNHSSKLVKDEELLRALKDLDISLKYGDEKNLSVEIDTQNIRKPNRMFSYEKFLEKAGVSIKGGLQSQKSTDNKLTSKEMDQAEEEIDIIKKELKYKDMTLYQMVEVKPDDYDIPWVSFKYGLEDYLKKYWIELSSDKDRLAVLRLYLCEGDNKIIQVKHLNKVFDIEHKRINDSHSALFEQEDDFRGDEKINKSTPKSQKKSQLNYSDEEEEEDDYRRRRDEKRRREEGDDYNDGRERRDEKRRLEETRKYENNTLKLDDKGRMNMAVNNLVQDLKTKQIDFNKDFVNKSGFYTDQEFSALLEKLEYSTQDPDEFDSLRAAFRDDKDRKKLSVKKMRKMFNTIDPTYLNKGALKSAHDAKMRLADLPEEVKENITRIDNFFKRNKYDIKQVFKIMDIDKDGTISEDEFCRVLIKKFKVPGFDLTQLKKIFQQLDINKSKSLTIGELMYFLEGAQRTEEERKKQMSKDVKDQLLYDVRKLYDEFDTENKGHITDKDLYIILKASGIYIDRTQCKDIIRDNGGRKTGVMSKRDFEKVMMEKMMNELIEDEDSINDLNSIFHQADINKDGFLTIDELEIMFKQYGTNIEKADLIGLMKEIDVDGDGRLDIDEF